MFEPRTAHRMVEPSLALPRPSEGHVISRVISKMPQDAWEMSQTGGSKRPPACKFVRSSVSSRLGPLQAYDCVLSQVECGLT